MPSYINNVLELIHDTLKYLTLHRDPILADQENCDYFRKQFKKVRSTKNINTVPKITLTPQKPEDTVSKPTPAMVAEPVVKTSPVLKKEFIPSNVLPLPQSKREDNKIPPHPPSEPKPQLREERLNALSFERWKKILTKIAPECHTILEIPSDSLAKKINSRWKTKNQTAPITVLCYQEIPEQKALLEQIAKALDVHFGPAKLTFAESIEKEKHWETFLSVSDLKLVICCDYTLWQLPGLLQFYKEIPALKTRQLGEKPLFLLPDLSLYIKDPLLKRSLWKALCQICDPALLQSSSTKI